MAESGLRWGTNSISQRIPYWLGEPYSDVKDGARPERGRFGPVCYNPYSMRLPRELSCRSTTKVLIAVALACGFGRWAPSEQRKKKDEDITQTLQLPKELPSA